MQLEFSQHIFEKYSHTTFHGNPFSGSRVVSCGRTDRQTDRQTDMAKLIDVFRNFTKSVYKRILCIETGVCKT